MEPKENRELPEPEEQDEREDLIEGRNAVIEALRATIENYHLTCQA